MVKILQVKNLHIGFSTEQGFFEAIHGVNFNLEQGELYALVGESGCGKSVTAMSILSLLPKNAKVTDGEILFDNKNLLKIDKKEMNKIRGAEIALIPQDPMTSLNPLYTIENQLLEVINIHQNLYGDEAKKKAIEALELVQIPDVKNRMKSYPHEFSGGMKQRAIIAMALACKSKIIIADEPTTALDVTIQAQIMKILADIRSEKNVSILLITHDLALVKENANRIAVMYAGEIVEEGHNSEFFASPSHPYTKALLNSMPNNITHARLDTITGQQPTIQQQISGCKFNPRCKHFMDICKSETPPVKEFSSTHYMKCHLAD